MGETETLAAFVVETEFDSIPDHVLEKATTNVRDYVGVAIYGSQSEIGEVFGSYVQRYESGSDASMVANGMGNVTVAPFYNGIVGHAADFDDGFAEFPSKPSTVVLPSCLAVAELEDTTGRELLAGYTVGVDVFHRVLQSVSPGHLDNGWHPTGTAATFGSAAAAASLFDFSVEETRNAFGIAASSTAGIFKNVGTMTKPYHPGNAAQMGVRSVLLTEMGVTADHDVLEDKFGWGQVYSTEDNPYDPDDITDGLGEEWGVMQVEYKLYPSGRVTHAPMKTLDDTMETEGITAEDVERIDVHLVPHADNLLGFERPTNAHEARFSIEFCLAAILREGEAGIDEFRDEYVTSEETREQIAKINRVVVEDEEELYGTLDGQGGLLEIELRDGSTISARDPHPPGSLEKPMSERQHVAKFRACAGSKLSADEIDTLLAVLDDLEADDAPERLGRAIR